MPVGMLAAVRWWLKVEGGKERKERERLTMTDIEYLTKRMQTVNGRHWLMFYRDTTNDTILAYDTSNPYKCYEAIKVRHPDFSFLALEGTETIALAANVAKASRLMARMLPFIRELEAERLKLL